MPAGSDSCSVRLAPTRPARQARHGSRGRQSSRAKAPPAARPTQGRCARARRRSPAGSSTTLHARACASGRRFRRVRPRRRVDLTPVPLRTKSFGCCLDPPELRQQLARGSKRERGRSLACSAGEAPAVAISTASGHLPGASLAPRRARDRTAARLVHAPFRGPTSRKVPASGSSFHSRRQQVKSGNPQQIKPLCPLVRASLQAGGHGFESRWLIPPPLFGWR